MKLKMKTFVCTFVVFAILAVAVAVSAQQAVLDRFVDQVVKQVQTANRLMEDNQVEDAVEALRDANRYIESVVNHDLETQMFNARKESRSFSFSLQVSLNSGFSADLWARKYEKANNSLKLSREAIAGLGSIRVLDRQEEALVYLKTIYDSVVTIKDVVSNVKTQSYLQAIKDAKDGVDGFIENYKAIEEANFRKQQTESLEVYMNGLVRRANRVINAVEPVLSFMKANAEEAERFEGLLARVEAVKQKVSSGVAQKMVYGDYRYTWNYEPFMREVKDLVARIKIESLAKPAAESSFSEINKRARVSWQEVCKNIEESDDEEQKPMITQANSQQWGDYEKYSRELVNEVLAAIKPDASKSTDKKAAGVNLFAGSSDAGKKMTVDEQPRKPNLFAGSDTGSNVESGKESKEGKKVDLFAGLKDVSRKDEQNAVSQPKDSSSHDLVAKKTAKKEIVAAKKLGEIYNTGTGDTSTHVGGNYLAVLINELSDDDILDVDVYSGSLNFVHIHLRNSRGVWFSIYNGTNTLFRVGNLIKQRERSAFTHIIFSVNSQHTKNLPIACRVNLQLHKAGSIPAEIAAKFSAQWRAGTGEISNEYVRQHPNLLYTGQAASGIEAGKIAGKSSSSQASLNKGSSQQTTTNMQANAVTDNKLDLANRVNAVIKRADADFNKKYWNEKTPQPTTQQATNSKASTLKIMREAIRISDAAHQPENRIFLNNLIANKLIEYANRVFEYVGKAEFHAEAAAVIKKTGELIEKVDSDKVTRSFLYSDQGDRWRSLGKGALVGNHAYNKNACYELEQASYNRALSIYPENHKAKKALNK